MGRVVTKSGADSIGSPGFAAYGARMSEHTIGGKTVKLTLPAGKAILGLVVAGLLLLGLMSSFYTVRTEEEAVVHPIRSLHQDRAARPALPAPVWNRPGQDPRGQAPAEAGVRLQHARSHESLSVELDGGAGPRKGNGHRRT